MLIISHKVHIATNGIFKALNPGQVLIKVYSRNLDRNGHLGDEIAKYVMINVS
ncbi:hypothetical protein [Clostridium tagluense]|uniref:hypothetical protein n=1 Tax=Clostridium tagluense TaxID=360422 RepID=UPI001C0AE563|nr:hypothetical protein [Clostridium tagluense]MBU3128748.1 hypothetical protein [Clostridium tagluense]